MSRPQAFFRRMLKRHKCRAPRRAIPRTPGLASLAASEYFSVMQTELFRRPGAAVVASLFAGTVMLYWPLAVHGAKIPSPRLRLVIETDAGGDPDDEQSLVRFLLYVNEWDVEGIIANRPRARDGENLNRERTGLGIVRALVKAYGECWPNLALHDTRYPKPEALLARTVAGYDDNDDAVNLILAAM